MSDYIVNHFKGDKHNPGTMVRWKNNTIAIVQNDGRHRIVKNNKSYQNGGKLNERKNRQLEWENEWENEIRRQKNKQRNKHK